MEPAHIIDTSAGLYHLVNRLRHVPLVAVDTESNSMFVYQERVCLIQLAVPHEIQEDFIVDPLMIEDISPLEEWFADPSVEIVFHAAEHDIMAMKRDFGFAFNNVFDTYIAARTLGFPKVGLRALLNSYFGVQVSKRYQQANWGIRPLSEKQLAYAQMDAHFLPALRNYLLEELIHQARWTEAQEYFDELPYLKALDTAFDKEGFWRIVSAYPLRGRALAILRELYLWRERIAQKRDLPPFKIISNETLAGLAAAMPQALEDLQIIKSLTDKQLQRYGNALLEMVRRGSHKPIPRPKPHPRPADEVLARFEVLQQWRKEKADIRGVDSEIILPKGALWALAKQAPKTIHELANISAIGAYRQQLYGTELLEVLATVE